MPDDLTKPVLDYGAYKLTPVTHNPFEAKENPKYPGFANGKTTVPTPKPAKKQGTS